VRLPPRERGGFFMRVVAVRAEEAVPRANSPDRRAPTSDFILHSRRECRAPAPQRPSATAIHGGLRCQRPAPSARAAVRLSADSGPAVKQIRPRPFSRYLLGTCENQRRITIHSR
jgi:hypothetical protein